MSITPSILAASNITNWPSAYPAYVAVNDVEIGCYHQEREDGAVDLRFAIPGAVAQSPADFCRIVFRHNSVYSPAEDGAGDARRLGFAVRSISLSPLPGAAAIPSVEDGAPCQDIANDEVVLSPDFSLTDGASADHLPAIDTSVIQTRNRVRPRRGRVGVRRKSRSLTDANA